MFSRTNVVFPLILVLTILAGMMACSRPEGCIDPNADNYDFDAQKSDGSCLYNITFWTNSEFGPLVIYIDGRVVDTLTFGWAPGDEPECGDKIYSISTALPPGTYHVFVESFDGTTWESDVVLNENCLKVLIDKVS